MGKRNVLFWISLPIALVGSFFLLCEVVTEAQAMYSLKGASQVIDARIVQRGLHGVKYRFRVSEDGPEFFRKRTGREIWSDPGESPEGPVIRVRYAPENPFVNRPAHEPIISANGLLSMILLLAIALLPLVCLLLPLVPRFRARRETYSKVLVWYSALAILSGAIGVAASMLDPAIRSYAELVPRQVRIFLFALAVGIFAFIVGLIGYVLEKQK